MVTRFIALLALVCGLLAPAWAQYPARPIRLVVPAAPGGGTDIVTRSVVPALSENLGQNVLIENRGGAGGIIGSDLVAKAAPDGYTLLMVYASHATNPTLNKTLPYDTLRDFAPITLMAHEPNVLVTHPSVPANTLAEFIAWAKEGAAKGKLSYATDPGSAGFLAGELFKQATGLKAIEYIPYKGSGPAAADVVAGHVPFMWSVISIATPFVKAGRMKALAIAAERRADHAGCSHHSGKRSRRLRGERLVRAGRAHEDTASRDRAGERRRAEGAEERSRARAPRGFGHPADRRGSGRGRRPHPRRDGALGQGSQGGRGAAELAGELET